MKLMKDNKNSKIQIINKFNLRDKKKKTEKIIDFSFNINYRVIKTL